MSNRERLEEAGILERDRHLTEDQREAIESLSEDEVDQLIALNDHLAEGIPTDDDPILEMPGRNPNPPDPDPLYKKKS